MAARKKGPVFRVTGLSASQPDDKLAASLETTIGEVLTEDGDSKLAVHLEIVPSCYDKDEKVALVEFRGGDPAFLAELTDKPLNECQLEMGTTDISFDRHFFGFTQLYTPKADASTTADVIAITGLDGHAYGSWRGKGNLGRMWLRDFLRRDLPSCRTMIYGYNSKLSSHGIDTIMDYGRAMLEELKKVRNTEELRKRPLFFIAHSFGGIIMAHCLVKAVQTDEDDHPTIASLHRATYGMLLFGIPHTGLVVDDIQKMVAGQDNHPRGALLEQIRSKSDLLAFQLADFKNLIRDRKVVSFYETLQTRQLEFDSKSKSWVRTGGYITAVDPDSALLQLPDSMEEKISLDADHSTIVKFDTRNSQGYTSARDRLVQFERDAPSVVAARFSRSDKSVRLFTVQPSVSEVSRVEHFVGREENITEICEALQYDGSRKTAVVHGLGGMGKTQLALAYEKRHRDEYSAVFWVNSKDVDTLKQGYAAAARRIYREHPSLVHLKAVAEGSDLNEAAEAVRRWLSSAGNDRWLVIYDNYDTPKLPGHDGPGTFDIRPFLPEADQGAILITTRSSQLQPGRPVAVKKLQNIKHSLEILSQTSRRDGLSLDADARKLADELDGLPLALATAGAYLHLVPDSFAEYLQSYEESWAQLQQDTPQLLSYEDRTLYTTWGISLDHVRQQSVLATKLLQLWAYFDNQDVWLQLLQEGRDKAPEWFCELTRDRLVFNKAVRVLCDHALVEADATFGGDSKESRGYGMHSCVHAWTKHVLNERWDGRLANLAITCVASHVPEQSKAQYWATDRRLAGHGDRCLALIRYSLMERDDNLPTPEAIRSLGVYYSRQGRLEEAEELYKMGLDHCEKAATPHIFTVETLNNLGNLYLHSDRLGEADEAYRLALEESEKALQGHPLLFRTVNHLGVCLLRQGKLDEAETMFERALEGRVSAFGPKHLSTTETVHNLGELYSKQGKNAEAEKTLLRALEGRERELGTDHILTLETVCNLSNLYRRQEKPDKAKNMLCRALKGFEQAFGPDHTSTLHAANNLGLLYDEHHELVQAEDMFSRALRGYEQAFGTGLIVRLEMINNLGSSYANQGKLDKGEWMYRRALEGRKLALGPHHPATINTLRCLGMVYASQGKQDK